MKKLISNFIFICALALFIPAICFADVGSPIMIIYGGVWFFGLAQLCIIPIEAVAIEKSLSDKQNGLSISWKSAFADSMVANLATSAIGLPLLSVFSFLFFVPYFFPFWIDTNGMLAYGAILTAVFLAVSFILSVKIESLIARKFFPKYDKASLKKAVFKANAASYIFLVILIVFLIAYSQMRTLSYINEHYKTPSGDFSVDPTINEIRPFACFKPEINTDNGAIKCGGKVVAHWACKPDGRLDGFVQDSLSAFGVTYFWVTCLGND